MSLVTSSWQFVYRKSCVNFEEIRYLLMERLPILNIRKNEFTTIKSNLFVLWNSTDFRVGLNHAGVDHFIQKSVIRNTRSELYKTVQLRADFARHHQKVL